MAPRRVREQPRMGPAEHDLLAGARELRFVSIESLPAVAQALQLTGQVVVVAYDGDTGRLVYYAQRRRAAAAPQLASEEETGGEAVEGAGATSRTAPRTHVMPAQVLRYEDEGSERCSLGAVAVDVGAWWSAALSVPMGDVRAEDGTLFLRLERHGPVPASYRGDVEAEVTLPATEVGAVVALLGGVVDQARQDGVLRPRS
jgi:hypothetical protein